jgi:hypothetical protein
MLRYFRPPDKTTWIEGRIKREAKERRAMDTSRKLILDMIDESTEPNKMGPAEAVAFLEELSTDIDGRIEGLKEENPELEP